MLTSIAGVRRLRSHLNIYLLSRLMEEDAPHPTPVTILMPLHPKDAGRAEATLRGLHERLAHPIERAVIVARDPEAFDVMRRALPAALKLEVLDENAVLPRAVLEGDFRNRLGVDRRGWIRQQFIKLCWPDFLDAERALTMDADTKPARRLRFLDDEGRGILYTADEYSSDYFASVRAILGPLKRAPWSFVAHCMLFERDLMLAMRRHVEERHGVDWVAAILGAIDVNVSQCLSEYELYGNFCARMRPQRVTMRYFLNRKAPAEVFMSDEIRPEDRRFRMLSSHYTETTYRNERIQKTRQDARQLARREPRKVAG